MVLNLNIAPDANRAKPFKAYQFFCDVDAGDIDAAMQSSSYVANNEYADSLYTYLDYLYAAKYEESLDNKVGAVEYYKKGLAVDSTKAPGFKAVADLYRQLGQAALGIEYYEKYLSLIGKEKSLGDDLGLANLYLAASNKCDSTQVDLRDQYKNAADKIYENIAAEMSAPENEGKYDAALFYLPWYYRAQLWITNPAEAEEKPKMYYEKALELIGENEKLARQREVSAQYLMLYHFKTNNDEECMKYLEKVLLANPNNRVANQILEVLM
jgi:tetratricopeptide (TPR) repeat protein